MNHIVNMTNAAEIDLLKEIILAERTSGIKLLYNSDTNDVTKTAPEVLGRVDTRFHASDRELKNNEPAIVGRIKSTNLGNIPTSIKYSVNLTITFEETKVIQR